MSIVPDDFSFYEHCVNLTKKKPEFLKRVGDAEFRILYVKNELGIFEDPYPHSEDISVIGLAEYEDVNLIAAQECVVLAKNLKNIIPLKKSKRLFVTGPTGNLMHVLNGGWSFNQRRKIR
jgi:beta-glucosidase